jgi:hypothetical protein
MSLKDILLNRMESKYNVCVKQKGEFYDDACFYDAVSSTLKGLSNPDEEKLWKELMVDDEVVFVIERHPSLDASMEKILKKRVR